MFAYNFKIAIRNLVRNKGFNLINILGLTLGMACSLIMLLSVYESYKVDTFHENFDRLYLFQQDVALSSGTYTSDRCGGSIGAFLKDNYPQIEDFVRVGNTRETLLAYFDKDNEEPYSTIEKQGIAVDSNFFSVFTFEMKHGNPQYACQGNNFIILTESLARKIFNEENPMGKRIIINEKYDLLVTGILHDVPSNSSLQFTFLVPFETMGQFGFPLEGFGGTNFYTYFILDNPGSKEYVNSSINDLLDKQHYDEQLKLHRYLTHIRKAFLYGEQMNYLGIYIFLAIGFGILLIACINYVNLTTAKSLERAKEIGIRKTGGASRGQLMGQFLGESIIVALISVHLAVLIVELALPIINASFNAHVSVDYSDPAIWIILVSVVFFSGFLSGLYPAFVLSNLRPAMILRDSILPGSKGNRLRKVLVVIQFSLTLFFIVTTLVLYKQFVYLRTADYGFERDDIIYVPTRGTIWEKYHDIKQELLQESSVLQVSSGSAIPNNVEQGEINWGKEDASHNIIARIMWASEDLDKTFNLELVDGKFYSAETPTENEEGVIVNQEIIRILGYEDDPIGKRFKLWDMDKKIIGVVKDYNFVPISLGGRALILPYAKVDKFFFIKIIPEFRADQLARIEGIFKKYNPNYPFLYTFLEDYEYPFLSSILPALKVLFYLCAFGIIISCLGLFGLALYTTQKKTKEIGIRKAFGASIMKIIVLLSKQYIKLVTLACTIAIPASVLAMKGVLSFFTVKTGISTTFILLIVVAMMLISVLTILYQSLQAARQNPIISLRYE